MQTSCDAINPTLNPHFNIILIFEIQTNEDTI